MSNGLLSVDEALAQLLAGARPVSETEEVPALEATGRILARGQRSTMDVPPMDNSAMDGYAVRLSDLKDKNSLLVKQKIMAGSVGGELEPGTAARIFTGAPIPPGADAVVMQEHCEVEKDSNTGRLDPADRQRREERRRDRARGQAPLAAGHRPRCVGRHQDLAGISEGAAGAFFHRRRARHAGRAARAGAHLQLQSLHA